MKKGMKKGILVLVLAAGVLTVGCGSKGKLDGEYTLKFGKLQCWKLKVEDNTVKEYYDGDSKKEVKSKYDPKTETITFKSGNINHKLKLDQGKYKFDNAIVNKNKPTQAAEACDKTIKDGMKKINKNINENTEKLKKNWDKEQKKLKENWDKEQEELKKNWEKEQEELKNSLGE